MHYLLGCFFNRYKASDTALSDLTSIGTHIHAKGRHSILIVDYSGAFSIKCFV